MNKVWLNKQENKDCILFFNGWGMDENIVAHLDVGKFDICMFYDYNPISKIDEDFDKYNNIYLVAWSLGVWVSAKLLSQTKIKIAKAIAINGTQKPIDTDNGIYPKIFKVTLETWNERNRNKFNMRMFGGKSEYVKFNNLATIRDVENQKLELSYIFKEIFSGKVFEINFDCAILGSNDLIFTSKNQLNYWKEKTRIVEKDIPHYPFSIFENWRKIIDL